MYYQQSTLKAYTGEANEPDEWNLQMIMQALDKNDGKTVTLENLAKELGITI